MRIGTTRQARGVGGAAAAGLALLLLAAMLAPAAAAPPTPTADELAGKRSKAAEVRQDMDRMQQDLSARIAESTRVSAQLSQVRGESAETARKLRWVEARLTRDQRQLNAFVVHTYQAGELSVLSTLLGAESFPDFLARARFIELLGEHEAETVSQLKESREASRRLRAALEARRGELAALHAKAQGQRDRLEADLAAQERMLDSMDSDIARLVDEQERASRTTAVGVRWAPAAGTTGWMAAASLAPGAYGTVDSHPGRRYLIPAGVPASYRSTGVTMRMGATSYSNADNGTGTSSGRPFDDRELTCAHKTLPFGTLVAVSYAGKHIIVAVTDRGPFTPGRDIDLSRGAASALGLPGIGRVDTELVAPAD